MAHSKGNWTTGNVGVVVVTDSGDGFPENTGHDAVKYYGGYLIAESILRKEDARLIAAAPDLLEACYAFMNLYSEADMRPEDECHELAEKIQAAIKKATDATESTG